MHSGSQLACPDKVGEWGWMGTARGRGFGRLASRRTPDQGQGQPGEEAERGWPAAVHIITTSHSSRLAFIYTGMYIDVV